jgi:hypothetical protein
MSYEGPDRRQIDRSPPAPLRVLGRAPIQPGHDRLYPALRPAHWYTVVDRDPAAQLALQGTPHLAGYVWIFVKDGEGRHVLAEHFEVELADA